MKGENKYKGVLSDIIQSLIERGVEAKKEATSNKDDGFQAGRSLAYYEVLDTIKNRLMSFDIPLKEVDFNIVPDKELLNKSKKRR